MPIAKLYRAFSHKATRDKSMRITWEDETSVDVYFTKKINSKSQVAIQHRKLTSKQAATKMKAYWAERLVALGRLLSPR